MEAVEQRIRSYTRELVEDRAYVKIIRDLLCFSYAFIVETKISELFVCSGCEENQANQLGHACLMLTDSERIDIYFERALETVNHLDAETLWRELLIQSCIPSLTLNRLINDETLMHDEEYVKNNFARKIKKCSKKIKQSRVDFLAL